LEQILRRPPTTWDDLKQLDASLVAHEPDELDVIQHVMVEVKYAGYVQKQTAEIERFRRLEDRRIPGWLDYGAIPQLRFEAREKLERVRPASLGQAGRISGINPADLATLLIHLRRDPTPGEPAEPPPPESRPPRPDDPCPC
jgi:tRNA uridine 5-carboxymethylaminomethyl modification enzyme